MKKYDLLRSEIRNGDIILVRCKSTTGKLIHLFDNAYYSHIGLVFEWNKRLFTIDSNSAGVSPKFLSEAMTHAYDFCILRPTAWTDTQLSDAIGNVIDRAEQKIEYDFSLVLQITLYRLFRIVRDFDNSNRDICSEFVRRYIRFLSAPKCTCFEQPNIPTNFISPWDFLLYTSDKFEVLFDECNRMKYRKV